MITDADQREGAAIMLRNSVDVANTAIRTGVPKTDGALAWSVHDAPSRHKHIEALQPGRVVAEGHVGEVRLDDPDTALVHPAGLDILQRQADLLEANPLVDEDGPYAVYADVWHRHVGAAEDARLVDPAFLAAVTSTRTERVAQIKFIALDTDDIDEDLAPRVENEGLPRYGDFRLLAVDFESEIVAPDICDPCAATLDDPNLDAGNDLFRLEIHESAYNSPVLDRSPVVPADPDGTRITLKWSRDNGSLEVEAASVAALLDDDNFDGAVFELTRVAGEQRMGLYTLDMSDRIATLHDRASIQAAADAAPAGSIVRVWDGAVSIDLGVANLDPLPVGELSAEGTIDTSDPWVLNLTLGGLTLTLEADVVGDQPFILPGDAWIVEIREYATDAGDKLIWEPAPIEIEHYYTFLGVILDGEFRNTEPTDLSARSFPALTELDAIDVEYDNEISGADAWTVQGALDLLFARPGGGGDDCQCKVCIEPGIDLEAQLRAIADELVEKYEKVLVCFPAGDWVLDKPVDFVGKGTMVFRGAGIDVSTIRIDIEGLGNRAALEFSGLNGVTVEDITMMAKFNVEDGDHVPRILGFRLLRTCDIHRSSFFVERSDSLSSHAITVANIKTTERPRTRLRITDTTFQLGAGAMGVFIGRGAVTLDARGNRFYSRSVGNFGVGAGVGNFGAVVVNSRAVTRTAAREAEIASGLFMEFPGNDRMLIDLSEVPEGLRDLANKYWDIVLPVVPGADGVTRPAGFERLKPTLNVINSALGTMAEAELTLAVRESLELPRPGSGGIVRSEDGRELRLLSAALAGGSEMMNMLSGFGDPGIVILNANPEGTFEAAIGNAVAISGNASDIIALPRDVLEANNLLPDGVLIADLADRLADILAAPGTTATNKSNYGIWAFTEEPMSVSVEGNSFVDMDVALSLNAKDRTLTPITNVQVPTAATIRDNTGVRGFRTNRIILNSEELPQLSSIGQHPISLRGYQDITVENNDFSQVKSSDISDEAYSILGNKGMSPELPSYTMIRISGTTGPKLRMIGNSAFSFRHAVYIDCQPTRPFPKEIVRLRQNFWICRENSVFPAFGDQEQTNWAVDFNEQNTPPNDPRIRFTVADNHPPNPAYDKQ